MATKKVTVKAAEKPKLNPRQELFCKYYSSFDEHFANGTQSYIKAYSIDATKKGSYEAARQSASDFLTNPHILARINELIELSGLNDEFVDKQLAFVISQNADMASKVAAMREYNKLKQRITPRAPVDEKGRTVIPILGGLSQSDENQGTGS